MCRHEGWRKCGAAQTSARRPREKQSVPGSACDVAILSRKVAILTTAVQVMKNKFLTF